MHHLGFVVDDLERAAQVWHATAGIGPFLTLEHVVFDELAADGSPLSVDHTAAFAAYGSIFVELQVIHHIEPKSAERYFRPSGPVGLNHIAHVAGDAVAERVRLTGAGMPGVVRARSGDLDVTLHDARAGLGCLIEVHQDSKFFRDFFGQISAAAANWNGNELIIKVRQP